MKKSEFRQFREKVVVLLFIHSMDGNFNEADYEAEILRRFRDIVANLESIDKVISDHIIGYTIDRLNYVDRAIIRNAVYELMFTELPYEIVINEAINLTKIYSNLDDDAAKRFNNRLLDNIRKAIKP